MKKITRQMQVENFDASAQLFVFSICSDTPYQRYDENIGEYNQILKISENTIDWSRLNSGTCAFLKDHDSEKQIGVIKKAWIEGNKVKCFVEFSSNPEIKYLIEDIKNGVITNTSIGYYINQFHWDVIDGVKSMIVDNFVIYEASLVSIPADPTVGYKRSLETQKKVRNMSKKLKETVQETAIVEEQVIEEKPIVETKEEQITEETTVISGAVEEIPAEETKEQQIAETKEQVKEQQIEEQSQEQEIIAAGQLAGEKQLAEECVKNKRSLAEFKNLLKEKKNLKNIKNKEIKTMEKFSISKAIRNACSQYKKDISEQYETKVIAENKRNFNVGEQADIVLSNKELFRALGPSAGKGAELVNTDYLPQEYTPVSRPHLTLEQTGYYNIPVNGNAISFAVCTSGAVGAMYTLDGELADGDMSFSLKTLTPHKAGVCMPVPYSLILQARPEIDTIVQDDIVKALEQIRDEQILIGNGLSGQVTGIANTNGVNTYSATSGNIYSWQGVLTMEQKIRDANQFGDLCFVMNSTSYKKYASTLKNKSNAVDGWILQDGKIKEFPVYVNNKLADGQIILGDFSQLVVADFEGLKLKVDDITYIKKQAIQIVAIKAFDVCIRKPGAFTVASIAE